MHCSNEILTSLKFKMQLQVFYIYIRNDFIFFNQKSRGNKLYLVLLLSERLFSEKHMREYPISGNKVPVTYQ